MNNAVEELLKRSQQLPTIPKLAQELIATFDCDDINSDEIANKIAMDAVISAKVLRLANAPAYGGSRKVGSIREAVMILGFNALRTLVLACSFVDSFRMARGFDIKPFWQNSFRVAAISKWLAQLSKNNPETAFTCGLMHAIGDLLIMAEHPTQFVNIDNSAKLGGDRADLELTLLGYNYCDVGAALAARWKFPEAIVAGIRDQQNPLSAEPFTPNAAIVALAAIIVRAQDADSNVDEIMDGLPEALLQKLQIDTRKMSSQLAELGDQSLDIAAFL